ncbi:hypothetical protein VTN31DRAFT_2695 [Thermomyces dupontii]|uniref:uncharacterized protein n=1 Tax=Talaromyces thermophilus TaxID=28565 RepID=UPI0037449D2F
MSSSVHFKFKSQKEPSRVTFDGTGISVFELKREIINQNRLGDGTDFELSIYNEDTGEEYDDDTAIIPRSTSVIARRLPAARPGKGGAARYVSGKAPVTARSTSRTDTLSGGTPGTGAGISNSMSELDKAQTEEEKIDALFNLQANQWKEQQQEMANATPVPVGRGRGKPVNVPDHPPPPGYLCYRCREKGHWIQACPTNNDPKFDVRYRVKRSTGIPRSLQTKVDKSVAVGMDGEELKNSGIMVNADGDFVIAQPDKASWELYQEKLKASAAAAAEAAAAEGNEELRARGLECPIDKRMFLEPSKTPCCGRTYCNECITNALIESDFVCPGCSAEGVLIDNLTPDEEAIAKIKAYEAEKNEEKKEKEKQEQEEASSAEKTENATSTAKSPRPAAGTPAPSESGASETKKRPAESETTPKGTDKVEGAPAMKKQKSEDPSKPGTPTTTAQDNVSTNTTAPSAPNQQAPFGNAAFSQAQGMGTMPFVDNSFMNQAMMAPYMNPMMMANFGGGGAGGWNGMNFSNFQQQGMFDPSMMGGNFGMFNNNGGIPMNGMMNPMGGFGYQQGGMNGFPNQPQRPTFHQPPPAREEDSPYIRQPVNPYRHQARQKRLRPTDYREL